METPNFEKGSSVLRAMRVLGAIAELGAAGYTLVLLPPEAEVTVRRVKSRRRWWAARTEGGTMNRKVEQEAEVVACAYCQLVPISVLSLDLQEPLGGWRETLEARGVVLLEDDLGRVAISRADAQALVEERRAREARLAAERAEKAAAARKVPPVAAGRPAAGEDLSALETMLAQPDFTSLHAELGRPKPTFLDEALAEGQRQRRDELAEREAVKRARRVLDQLEGKGK